jgi:hypothetical protein
MNEKTMSSDSSLSEIQKFIDKMNEQLGYYTQNLNNLSKISDRLFSEPTPENDTEKRDDGDDIMGQLSSIRYLIERNNANFEYFLIKLNKLV